MYVARLAAAAGFCALAAIPVAVGQQSAVTTDSGWTTVWSARTSTAAAGRKAEFAWPALPDAQPTPPGAKPPPAWSKHEVELARARCSVLLKGMDIVVVPEAPVRDGAECGAPAPMQLVSIGSSPQVAFSPPPTLTCDMIAALYKWVQTGVQPAARKHLGTPVVRVATMSSYSCRNAYGRARARLSEHGRMNAIDVGAFVTATGKSAMILADWGPSAREIAAKAAEQQRLAAEAAAKAKKGGGDAEVAKASTPTTTTPTPLRPSIAATIPGITLQIPSSGSATLGLTPPTRLGGPKANAAPPPPPPLSSSAQFLRAAHESACKVFGTVLGPEANAAHSNHFHLDMAERKVRVICE